MANSWYRNVYLRSPRWQQIRRMRRAIDGDRCVICGRRAQLDTHHLSYKYTNRGGRRGMAMELASTINTCRTCHNLLHAIKALMKRKRKR